MPDIRIISWNEHGAKRWFKPTDFRFAARDRLVTLGFSEIPKAMMSLPLALCRHENDFMVAAVQGFLPGQNLVVSASGQWLADYVPLLYRTLPFKLARSADGQFVLCADHDSGLVTDAPAGFQFYEDEKKLSAASNEVVAQLTQFESERPRIRDACQLLDSNGLIESWPLQVQQGDEILAVDGLFRINERKLMELPAAALAEIRDKGGLMLAYAQLLSMQHLQQLGTMAQRTHWANRMTEQVNKVAPLNIVDENGILSFANM